MFEHNYRTSIDIKKSAGQADAEKQRVDKAKQFSRQLLIGEGGSGGDSTTKQNSTIDMPPKNDAGRIQNTTDEISENQIHQFINSLTGAAMDQLQNLRTLDSTSARVYKKMVSEIRHHAKKFQKKDQSPKRAEARQSLEKLLSLSYELLDSLEKGKNLFPPKEVFSQERRSKEEVKSVYKDYRRNFRDKRVASKFVARYLTDMLTRTGEGERPGEVKRPGGVGFDVGDTLIDREGKWKFPDKLIKDIETFLNNGIPVMMFTGFTIEAIHAAFDEAGPRGKALKGRVEVFGEYGDLRQGPKTGGVKELTNPDAKKYVEPARKVMETIQERIEHSKTLNELKRKGHIPKETPITFKKLGGTVLGGKAIHDLRGYVTQKSKENSDIDVGKTVKAVCDEVQAIVKGVLKARAATSREDFIWEDTGSSGINIRLNSDVTHIESGKGAALEVAVRDYQLPSIVIIGDDTQAVVMKEKARSLIADNRFRESSKRMKPDKSKLLSDLNLVLKLSELKPAAKLAKVKLAAKLPEDYKISLTDKEISELKEHYNISLTDEQLSENKEHYNISLTDEQLSKLPESYNISLTSEQLSKLQERGSISLTNEQLSESKERGSISLTNEQLSELEERDYFHLTKKGIEIKIEELGVEIEIDDENKKNDSQKDLQSSYVNLSSRDISALHAPAELQDYAFIAVRHPSDTTPTDRGVVEGSTFTVEGTKGTLELVSDMVQKIKEIRPHENILFDCWRQVEDSQFDIEGHLEKFKEIPNHENMTKLLEALNTLEDHLQFSHVRVREISSDFENSLLDMHTSIIQFKRFLSETFQATISNRMLTSAREMGLPDNLGQALFKMPLDGVASQWSPDSAETVRLLRAEIYKSFDQYTRSDENSTPFLYDNSEYKEMEDVDASAETKEPEESPKQSFQDRVSELLLKFTNGENPFNKPIEDVALQWEKDATQPLSDTMYASFVNGQNDSKHSINSFLDKISKHMLSFTKEMVRGSIPNMSIKDVKLQWGYNYARAVQLIRGEDAAKMASSAKPEGITYRQELKASDILIEHKIKDEDVLKAFTEIEGVKYSTTLNPENGAIKCDRNSSGKTERAWQVWGLQVEALAAEFQKLKALAAKSQELEDFVAQVQKLKASGLFATQVQELEALTGTQKEEALVAKEIDDSNKFSITRDILGIKNTEGSSEDTEEGRKEWQRVVKAMEEKVREKYPNMPQVKLTEVTIPVDDETKDALELFVPQLFDSQTASKTKTYGKGSELHTALLGTQGGQVVSSLQREVLVGQQVTEITPARDTIKFTLGPNGDFGQGLWKSVEWDDITSDDDYKHQQIMAGKIGKIDAIDPNWRINAEEGFKTKRPEAQQAKQELNELIKRYEALASDIRERKSEIAKLEEQADFHDKLVDYRQGHKGKSTAGASDQQKTDRQPRNFSGQNMWNGRPKPRPEQRKPSGLWGGERKKSTDVQKPNNDTGHDTLLDTKQTLTEEPADLTDQSLIEDSTEP